MKPSSRLLAYAAAADDRAGPAPLTVSFVSQKGGVGKSTLARLFAVGAAHRGLKPLLADFDLEQLTCVEWNAIRLQNSVEPDIDARAFKSLKKLRKNEERAGIVVADTRGLADDLAHEIAEDSDVVFLPTGASGDDLRPTLALARKLAKHGARGAARRRALEGRPLGSAVAEGGRGDRGGRFRVAAGILAAARRLPERSRLGRAGREARNPYLREAAEKMEEAFFARARTRQAALMAARAGSADLPLHGGRVPALARPTHDPARRGDRRGDRPSTTAATSSCAGSPIPSGSSPSAPSWAWTGIPRGSRPA